CLLIMAIWPGGSCWSFCCCAPVLGVITLKPDATSMLSLFCVLAVVAQPAVNANRTMTLVVLNEVRICFILLIPCTFALFFICYRRPLASTHATDSPLDSIRTNAIQHPFLPRESCRTIGLWSYQALPYDAVLRRRPGNRNAKRRTPERLEG